jgi:hypothetical protein
MLSVVSNRGYRDCDGVTRRDLLRIGALGAGGLTLSGLLAARAEAASVGRRPRDASVVWLWLGGGPTHVETFDPKMSAPSEYRSVTGEVRTVVPGVTIGGTFPRLARVADRMVFVRSFAHENSGHGGGTHWVMTGYDHPPSDNGMAPIRPSAGSILARYRGANHPRSGMPTYVRMGDIHADGPAFLGSGCAPFDSGGEAVRNMRLSVPGGRLGERRHLLEGLDRLSRRADTTGLMQGLDDFEKQAFGLLLGNAAAAFDLSREDPRVRESYGDGLGEQMLLARRLCEAGCGFVTIHYGGWDMHGDIQNAMQGISLRMDRAVAAFIEDLDQRGLLDRILLVITGEFGRTPKVNGGAGRDHWAPLSTLALAGGGLKLGGVVGESSDKVEVPATTPVTPQDLMATVFHVLDIPRDIQFRDHAGRPVYMIDRGAPVPELV